MKTALITGGSRGIGLGIAIELSKKGFNLAINGVRDESLLTETLDRLGQYGGKVVYCQGNISDITDRQSILQRARKQLGPISVLINNAGVAPRERKDMLEITEEDWDYLMNINLKGNYFITQQMARQMIADVSENPEFKPSIINITSVSVTMASPKRAEYCISKAGLSMMSQSLAVRLAEFNIPVYEVRPGVIKTDMISTVLQKYEEQIRNGLTLESRLGTPEDIGKAVASLATGEMPYATGQVFTIDGGMTVGRL